MKVDVIIPTYNRSNYIIRAIESVINQSYQQYELYVIDDGSTDDTQIKLQRYINHPQIHYLFQTNKGVSAARNFGITNSNSKWIAFLDSDDEWHPNKLEKQFEYLAANQNHRFIHSNEIWVRNGKRVNPKLKFDKSSKDLFERSLETCLVSPSTVILERDLFNRYGPFDEDFPVCEDYDLWLKILAHEEVGFISENLTTKLGGHGDQLSTKFFAMDFWKIKSMINLLKNYQLNEHKKIILIDVINKKASQLLKGYQKHNNLRGHNELLAMLNFLNHHKA